MNLTHTFSILGRLAEGIPVTLAYSTIPLVFGLIIGTALSLFRLGENKILSGLSTGYISIFRGTPLLLQISLV